MLYYVVLYHVIYISYIMHMFTGGKQAKEEIEEKPVKEETKEEKDEAKAAHKNDNATNNSCSTIRIVIVMIVCLY